MTKPYQLLNVQPSQGLDVEDLAAHIVMKAIYEWRDPSLMDYEAVCEGDELLGFKRCPFHAKCFTKTGRRKRAYDQCLHKRSALKQELVEFFNSPWFEFLCGDLEPQFIRESLGVPALSPCREAMVG